MGPRRCLERAPLTALLIGLCAGCRAKEWLVKHIDFNISSDISFFEITIRVRREQPAAPNKLANANTPAAFPWPRSCLTVYSALAGPPPPRLQVLGGLLSAHQLTEDPFFLAKAVDLGDRLLPAFSTSATGIPDSAARLPVANTGSPAGVTCLVELGSDTLEFGTLSALTGDRKYIEGAEKGIRAVHARYPTRGLLSHDIERSTGAEVGSHLSIGPRGDSYYEYLIKWWLLGGKVGLFYLFIFSVSVGWTATLV